MKRTIAALVIGLAWPVPAGTALGPRYGGSATIGVLELPAAEPAVSRSWSDRLMAALAHETLVRTGADGLALPALAMSWSSTATGREWVIRLRDHAAFHDGAPVTGADAVRSLRRFLRSPSRAAETLADALEGGAQFRAGHTEALAGLDARGPRVMALRLRAPRAVVLSALASPAAAVIGAGGVGCGPFVPAAALPGRRATFVAAAGHVRGRPYIDRIELVAMRDPAQVLSELQSGRIDLAASDRNGPLAAVLLLVADPTQPPFDVPEGRAALAGAVDREDLVRHLMPGAEAGASLLPPLLMPPLAPQRGSAPASLRGTVRLVVSREVPSRVSQRVVAHLTDLGLRVEADPRAPGRVLEGGPAALRLLLWTPEVPEAGLALYELAALLPPLPEVRQALEAASAELDLDRRRGHLFRAEAALRASHLLVPLAAAPVSFRAARGLQGVRVDTAGRLVLEDAWWEP